MTYRLTLPYRSRFGAATTVLAFTIALAGLAPPGPAAEPADAKPVLVVGTEAGAQYGSVQAAIDAAPDGAVIRIGPGVFTGPVKIDKSLTLEGAGWDQTTITVERPTADEFSRIQSRLEERLRAARTEPEQLEVFRDAAKTLPGPVIEVDGARGVVLRNLKVSAWAEVLPDGFHPAKLMMLVRVARAAVQVDGCALLGSPAEGLVIADGSEVEVRNTLIAAVGGTGISVGTRDPGAAPRRPRGAADAPDEPARVSVVDCDVRNCHYAGIRIRPGHAATVERCRISGAAWHGVRYDDASPTITGCRIFANARCGIYASGKTAATITGNLLTGNDMVGMCCWKANGDTIAGNTFVGNARGGLAVNGALRPLVERNVFAGHPVALTTAGSPGPAAGPPAPDAAPPPEPAKPVVGDPQLKSNLFWDNAVAHERITITGPSAADVAAAEAGRRGNPQPVPEPEGETKVEQVPLDGRADDRVLDPRFARPDAGDYALAPDSPARRDGIGAADPLPAESPWPLQPEERAIIPNGPGRDWRLWKRAPGTARP